MTGMEKPVMKLVLCGEYGVGKSSLFRRFVHDSFVESSNRTSTLGFDHFEKTYRVEGREVVLQLWDTGGLERVASVTSSYFKHADAALLCFSYDAYESFNALSHHLIEVLSNSESAKLFLCGNKIDNMDQGMGPSDQDVDAFYDENQIKEGENLFKQMYKVSCKTKFGVHEMFYDIAAQMARMYKPPRPPLDHFQLTPPAFNENKSSCCNGTSDSP